MKKWPVAATTSETLYPLKLFYARSTIFCAISHKVKKHAEPQHASSCKLPFRKKPDAEASG